MKTKRDLSAQEISTILEVCGRSGVTELKFGDLYVRFGPKALLSEPPAPSSGERSVNRDWTPPKATEMAETQKKIAGESLLQEEKMTKEDQIAMLLVEDPVEYERMIRDGELEEDEPGQSDGVETP